MKMFNNTSLYIITAILTILNLVLIGNSMIFTNHLTICCMIFLTLLLSLVIILSSDIKKVIYTLFLMNIAIVIIHLMLFYFERPAVFFVLVVSILIYLIYINFSSRNTIDFSHVVNSTPIPTLVVNKKYIVTHYNKACEELCGIPPKEVLNKKNRFLFYSSTPGPTVAMKLIDGASIEEIKEEFKDMDIRYVNEGYEGEFHSEKANKWIEFRVGPIFSKNKKIIGAVVTMVDSTRRKLAEQELIQSKDLYYKLINFSPNAYIVHNENKIFFSNVKCNNLIGISNPQMLFEIPLSSFVKESEWEKLKLLIIRAIERKSSSPVFSQKILNANGKIIYTKIKSTHFKYNGIDALLTSIEDISEQIFMKNELEIQKEYLNKLFENSPFAMVIKDNNERIVNVNKSFIELTGYKREELINHKLQDLIVPEHLLKESNSISDNAHKGDIIYTKTQRKRKDGKLIEVSIVCCPIIINSKNIGGYVIYKDITLEKTAQENLKKSEERYRQLVELLPLGIITHKNGKITFVNKSTLKILGINKSEKIIDSSFYDLIHPKYRKKMLRCNEELILGKSIDLNEIKIIKSDNTVICVEIGCMILHNNNNNDDYEVISVIKDISERKKAQELQKKFKYEKQKLDFFANLSHELKTPLNVIFSTIQLLNMYIDNNMIKNDDKKISKRIDSLKQNGFRLIRIVNNLIDITKIDSGYLSISLQNYDIVKLIKEISLSVSDYIESNGISLEFNSSLDSKIIACDSSKVERIILNILSNAIKFTEQGGSIKINIYEENDMVVISIKDTGIGIKKEYINSIFKRFVQVNKSLTRSHEGSGIGLYLVKSLVELHGGTISVESKYKHGSNFIIKLHSKVIEDTSNKLTPPDFKIGEDFIDKANIEFSDIYKK